MTDFFHFFPEHTKCWLVEKWNSAHEVQIETINVLINDSIQPTAPAYNTSVTYWTDHRRNGPQLFLCNSCHNRYIFKPSQVGTSFASDRIYRFWKTIDGLIIQLTLFFEKVQVLLFITGFGCIVLVLPQFSVFQKACGIISPLRTIEVFSILELCEHVFSISILHVECFT